MHICADTSTGSPNVSVHQLVPILATDPTVKQEDRRTQALLGTPRLVKTCEGAGAWREQQGVALLLCWMLSFPLSAVVAVVVAKYEEEVAMMSWKISSVCLS